MAVYYTIVQYSNINQYTTTVSWLSCVIGDREKGNREMTIPGAQPPGGMKVGYKYSNIPNLSVFFSKRNCL